MLLFLRFKVGHQMTLKIISWHQMENPPQNSKSLVLITRVGSTPTTGIKKRTSPACLGEFSFLSAACERVEQHGSALQGERSALRAVAQCAGDPHHRHKKEAPSACLGEFCFFICGV